MIERFLRSRAGALAMVALASLPLVISVVGALHREDWQAGDRAIMGLFTHDVFSDHPPLLGTVSTLGNYTEDGEGEEVHHLGPAQFYALAVPDLLASGQPGGLLVGGLLINVAAIAVVVWCARRRLGPVGGAAATLVVVGLGYGLGATILRDIWTPHLGLWPLLALIFATWSLVDGDTWALPWAAAWASFLAQIELLFVGPALVLSVVGLVGLLVARRHDRADPDRVGLLWPAVVATLVSAVIWVPVVLQELRGEPGNLTLLIESLGSQDERVPLGFVTGNLVALLGLPPIWLRRASLPFQVGDDVSVAAVFSAVLVLAALVALTVWAWRGKAGPRTVRAMLVTTWAMLVGGAFNLVITPAEGIIGLQYRRWMWPAGAFLWLTVAVAASYALRPMVAAYRAEGEAEEDEAGARADAEAANAADGREDEDTRTPAGARPGVLRPAAVATVLLALAALAVVPASTGQRSPVQESAATRRSIESAWDTTFDQLPPQPTFVTLVGADAAFAIGPEIIRRMVVHGWDVRVPAYFSASFGEHRVLTDERPAAQTLELVSDESTLAPSTVPVQVIAAGRRDGRSGAPFVRQVAPILERLRTAGPFVPTPAGRQVLLQRFDDRPSPDAAVAELLALPTRTMFDEGVLELQLAGGLEASPLTNAEAAWLLRQLRAIHVVGYLTAAPER